MLRRLQKLFGFECRPGLRHRARPAVELLEDRTLPSSYTAASVTAQPQDIQAANTSGGTGTVSASTSSLAATFTYTCSATLLGRTTTFTSTIEISGHTPASVAPGATVKMTGFQLSVTIPATFVNAALSHGVKWIGGRITTFDIAATDAKVGKVNAAGRGITIPQTNLVANRAVTLVLPSKAITVGSWTASKAGTMSFTPGALDFTLTTNLGVSVTVTGSPKAGATISTTTVT